MATDIDAALDAADLSRRELSLCLRGSLRAEWETASAELETAREQSVRPGATQPQIRTARKLAERVHKLEQQMRDESVRFVVQALPFADYNALVIKYPPRENNASDRVWGFNTAEFLPELVRVCIVEPELNDARWERLTRNLSDGLFDQLADAAIRVNRRDDGGVPFSEVASELMRGSGATSS